MKYRIFLLGLFFSLSVFSQEKNNATFEANYFYGNIPVHNNNIAHLVIGHPEGVILSWNKKTYGKEEWEQMYNYPDYGISFTYQNLKNNILGDNFGLYAHYNFYFFKRYLMVRIGQGFAYTTNPYDKETNFKNNAFGSKILSSTYAMVNFKKERLFDNFGLQAGLSLIHYSNANVKAPNISVNSVVFNVGVNYNFLDEEPEYIKTYKKEKFTEPIKYNIAFRSGINQSDVVGSGQFPFYIFSFYADKRINKKSAFQLGTEAHISMFLKEFIRYKHAAFPKEEINLNSDYKRVGVFAGHELFINKLSIVTQLGYYIYYPFEFEGRVYQRVGLKRYINDKWFAALTLKSHAAKAEAVEVGIGVRL